MGCRSDYPDHCFCGSCSGCRARSGGYGIASTQAPVMTVQAPVVNPFDYEGALCDVLTYLESYHPDILPSLDPKTIQVWKLHEAKEAEKTRQEALAKLTPKEKRALGIK